MTLHATQTRPGRNVGALSLLLSLISLAACTPGTAQRPEAASLIKANAGFECQPPEATDPAFIRNLIGGEVSVADIDGFLDARMADMDIPGISLAIINDSEVVFHRAKGMANIETGEAVDGCTIFEGASITKPLFGYFVMGFVEDGKLDLDRPLYEYLPYRDIAYDDRYKAITARMVLTHQTGFPNWRTDFPDKKLFIKFDPGEKYGYSGEAYQYLALVLQEIEGVDGPGLEALFQARVARPLGMTHTQIIPSEAMQAAKATPYKDGAPTAKWIYTDQFGAAYGVNSEARDFSKWLIAVIERRGLSEATFEEYLSAQDVHLPQDFDASNSPFGPHSIALGFQIYEVPGIGKIYMHDGNNTGFSSLVIIHPEQKWGMVMFANADHSTQIMQELALFLNTPRE
jgi:CubicO group peptidase (beta-lactamase class C family)